MAALTLLLAAGCAGLDQSALEGYENIRRAISVTTDPATGAVTASSEPAAKIEYKVTDAGHASLDESGLPGGRVNPQRSMETAFFTAERLPGNEVSVFVVQRRRFPIAETQLQDRPWTETDPNQHGQIGEAWQTIPLELMEFRSECPASKLRCTRYETDRLRLSPATVRVLLAQNKKKIRVAFDKSGGVDWQLDANELIAVLDGVGFSLSEATR